MEKTPVLVSACLLGLGCRYDGKEKQYSALDGLERVCSLIPACPEQLGGLSTPRPPAERQGERVVAENGTDVTVQYERGASQALYLARRFGCRYALLKEKSPSCGCGRIYDGTFSRTLTEGNGVTAELFLREGIEIYGESRADELICRLKEQQGKRGYTAMKETKVTRAQALDLLRKYNQEPFHILHGLTVEAVMRWYAEEAGRKDEADFWGLCGLLHDVDFEKYPEEHCKKAPELLAEIDAEPELVHAVVSHGYGPCSDVEPEDEMENFLFASDELTGLIWAAAKMRPSKSCTDMELSSLKKKFKDKRFAAGCSRDTIRTGAERLGWSLDELLEKTLNAMKATEASVNQEAADLTGDGK
ncbi:MAG TPA: DUF523 domain-containing protein [Candidatus Lachnoclostridium pullistercoris]|uniref:DUF523 domain-containing protein n=1 Tax=Candidatus Lachnoclostridium pullistercoris TaxID=2838632 RepID=A0A9D2PE86_9FIRM|nr:DUF523 domain-containing protein [Candidatus Lachnoclostridium pullistercoris]